MKNINKYFSFFILLFLLNVNYAFAFQKATAVNSLTFKDNKCVIKGNGYMFFKTFTMNENGSKILILDIYGVNVINETIPSFLLVKDSNSVILIKTALHNNKNIGFRIVFTLKHKGVKYQIGRSHNIITVSFNNNSDLVNNQSNTSLATNSNNKVTSESMSDKNMQSNTNNTLLNTVKSIIIDNHYPQIKIATSEKPVYEVKNDNDKLYIDIKNATYSKPLISNKSKLAEDIQANLEKGVYKIVITTNNAKLDAVSSSQNSIFIALSPTLEVQNLHIVSKSESTKFTGKKISFDVQDASLQDVLRVIASTAHLNVVIGSSVKGSITMRLMNIPWDEALDLVAKQEGLVVQKQNDVLLINTTSSAAQLTKEQLESMALQQSLERKNDAQAQIIKLNYISPDYAKTIIDSLLYGKQAKAKESIGFVVADKVNNSIICYDTKQNIKKIENIIKAIDVRKREIEISAKVVMISKGYERDLGIQWGGDYAQKTFGQNSYLAIGGANLPLTVGASNNASQSGLNLNGYSANNNFANSNYVVNAPASSSIGNLSMMIGNVIANYNLDLTLSMAEMNDYSKILSSPKIITLDNQEATVESGEEIPYNTITTTGTQSTSFKNAVLSLKVTPHITNNGDVIMKLEIKDDSPGATAPDGELTINKNDISSTIIVNNGKTIAIGGVYEKSTIKNENGIPFLKDIPLLGWLFKSQQIKKPESELYIFITPKIL